tara:strand:- start:2246 stop:2944 length:699 start_codon:yes stop_codon:yes gene_type:complete
MTWFSIVKNRLLVKPKTQLRVQDNKEIDDNEPCKEKLKEYYDYVERQKNNYDITNDEELKESYEGWDFKIEYRPIMATPHTGVKATKYSESVGDQSIDFSSAHLVIFSPIKFNKEAFEKLPEKTVCKILDKLEENIEKEHYFASPIIDGYKVVISIEKLPLRFQEGNLGGHFMVSIYSKGRGITNFGLEVISFGVSIVHSIVNNTDSENAPGFYSRVLHSVLNRKLNFRNWK